MTSHNTDPLGNDGLILPATAQEVGLVDGADKDNYNAGDVTPCDCSCPTYRECGVCEGDGIDKDGHRCSHCDGHGWHK